jgi:hypothetical protein
MNYKFLTYPKRVLNLLVFTILSFAFLIASYNASYAQKTEVGLLLGGSVYSGDLSPDFINVNFIRPAGGLFYRYNHTSHWAYKAAVFMGTITGDDASSSDPFQRNRNLSFTSRLLELTANVEFNFLEYATGDLKRPFTPYVFTGISIFDFNPKTEYKGEMVELKPLGTEGQNLANPPVKSYSLVQLAIPMGLGIKWSIGQRFSLGFEIGARKTFTNYLDDVGGAYADKKHLLAENGALSVALSDRSINKAIESGRQRGSYAGTDWYTFGGISFSITLGRTKKVTCDPFTGN